MKQMSTIASGETIRWTAAAPRGLRLRRTDAFLIPVSLVWGGSAIAFEAQALHGPYALLDSVTGAPIALIGLYLIAGRFAVDAWLRARTSYTVTDRAAYISRAAPFARERCFAAGALDTVTLEHIVGPRATIRFVSVWDSMLIGMAGGFSLMNEPLFDAFLDVIYEEPYRAIRDLRQPSKG